jgi:hypothetical protein
MRALAASCRRYFWLAAVSTFVAGCSAGWVRLLPWLYAPALPLAALGPFVFELGIAAAQGALLIGVPLAAALGSLTFHERGEARALFALGVSPGQCAGTIARALLAPVLAVLLLIAGARASHGDDPLELLVRTSDAIRERCAGAAEPVAVPLPGTDLSWLCERPAAPRLVGPAPGGAGQLWLSGRTLELDAERLSVQGAQLVSRVPVDGLAVTLEVDRFALRGFSGARPALPRLDLLGGALTGVYFAALLLAVALLRRERIPRWLPLCLGLCVGCSALVVIGSIRQATPTSAERVISWLVAIAAPLLSASAALLVDGLALRLARRRLRPLASG